MSCAPSRGPPTAAPYVRPAAGEVSAALRCAVYKCSTSFNLVSPCSHSSTEPGPLLSSCISRRAPLAAPAPRVRLGDGPLAADRGGSSCKVFIDNVGGFVTPGLHHMPTRRAVSPDQQLP